jgi:ribosomal protein S16
VIKADSIGKKQNPFDKIVETGTKKQRDLNAIRKIGLDNPNDHTYSKIGSHEVWFKEAKDRKLDPTFKDNTTRSEHHVYNRTAPIKNEKFNDGCDKLTKPRVREADFGAKPKTKPRETSFDRRWCHVK